MGRPKGTKASIEERIVEYFATVELKSAETLFNVVRGIVKTRAKNATEIQKFRITPGQTGSTVASEPLELTTTQNYNN